MAASAVPTLAPNLRLTLDEFDRLYSEEKPYYEYWDGEAVQKSVANLLHSYLQYVLMQSFFERGLTAAAEVCIRLSKERQPLPDVISDEYLEGPYPTEPFAIAIEILSPDDKMQFVLRKLRFYAEHGIRYIYLFDPEDRMSQRWNTEKGWLEAISEIELPNREPIPMATIWSALDDKMRFMKTKPTK